MKTSQLQPAPEIKIAFKQSECKKIPTVPGCYVLTTFQDDILYIGRTDDLNRRFQEHLDCPEKTQPTVEGRAVLFCFLEYESNKIKALEKTWIQTFKITEGRLPVFNKNTPSG